MLALKPIACHKLNLCRTTPFTENKNISLRMLTNFYSSSNHTTSHILLLASRGLSSCNNNHILHRIINTMHYFLRSTRHNTWERRRTCHAWWGLLLWLLYCLACIRLLPCATFLIEPKLYFNTNNKLKEIKRIYNKKKKLKHVDLKETLKTIIIQF